MVGLSAVSKLSVFQLLSTMMATWFLANAWAGYVSGIIAGMAETETIAGAALDNKAALESSLKVFEMLGWWGVSASALRCAPLASSSSGWRMAHSMERPEVMGEAASKQAD